MESNMVTSSVSYVIAAADAPNVETPVTDNKGGFGYMIVADDENTEDMFFALDAAVSFATKKGARVKPGGYLWLPMNNSNKLKMSCGHTGDFASGLFLS